MNELKNVTRDAIVYDKVNNNGRIYNREAMHDAFAEFKNRLDEFGVIYGELGHPAGYDISMTRASHACTNVTETETGVDVNWHLLNTAEGKMIRETALLFHEVGFFKRIYYYFYPKKLKAAQDKFVREYIEDNFVLNPRGSGTIEKNEKGEYEVKNYKLFTFDLIRRQESAWHGEWVNDEQDMN